MPFWFYLALVAYLVIAGFLVWLVLVQEPKQGGLTSSFGGNSEFLGGRGVTGGLIRLTLIFGGLYLLAAVLLNRIRF